jgi:hypothetical protein
MDEVTGGDPISGEPVGVAVESSRDCDDYRAGKSG